MSRPPAVAAMWGQSRVEEAAARAAAHLAAYPVETGGWRRPVRDAAVLPVTPTSGLMPRQIPAAAGVMGRTDNTKIGEVVEAGPRPAPTVPVPRRCEGGVTHLHTFVNYRARLGDNPIAYELEDAWLSSEVWALHTNAIDGEEVGAYAVRKRRDRIELTLFYLNGPSARCGEVALLQAIATHQITEAVVSTTDSYAMGLLLDLELAGFTPRSLVYSYGGSEPRFGLLPKIQWPASPRGRPNQLSSPSGDESDSNATVRVATSSDCGRLAALLGGIYPEFSRRVAAEQLLVAVLSQGKQSERLAGAGWWTPSILQMAQDEFDRRKTYSTRRPRGSPSDPAADIKVFVCREYRRRGVGCSLATALIQAVRRSGLAPVASCPSVPSPDNPSGRDSADWKSVLEAGGMVSLSRVVEVSLAS